ncbi:asparagine synthetase B [Escherichia coli]|nr:asparagine synthetase B [Escherichia coli]
MCLTVCCFLVVWIPQLFPLSPRNTQPVAWKIRNALKPGGPQLHSFAVGLPGSPDLKAAQEVANHLGTVHHEIHFTVQEGLDAIRDVIYHIETYDVTTIRASTPMYLMSRKIKAMGIKMVLSGEGSDEVFGGYLYFHKAPNAKELHEETVRKLLALHMYDCARANKAMSAWGVEARVPFLDKKFLDVAMRINPQDKMCGNGKNGKTHPA